MKIITLNNKIDNYFTKLGRNRFYLIFPFIWMILFNILSFINQLIIAILIHKNICSYIRWKAFYYSFPLSIIFGVIFALFYWNFRLKRLN